jgi:hypothetical protein
MQESWDKSLITIRNYTLQQRYCLAVKAPEDCSLVFHRSRVCSYSLGRKRGSVVIEIDARHHRRRLASNNRQI